MQQTIAPMIALSPSGGRRAPLVVAAVRAGALGVLDGSLGADWAASLDEAHAAARLLGGRTFGVRVGSVSAQWLDALPESARVIWVQSGFDGGCAPALMARLRQSGRAVLVEARTRDEAWAAADAGCDGLVIAGHEAGGRGGEVSSYILLQAVLARSVPPVWVRGGIGPHVAAACVAMGARGVVLEGALLLARESPLDGAARIRIRQWDGSETAVFGRAAGAPLRLYVPPGSAALDTLRSTESVTEDTITRHVGWGPGQAWAVGPEAAWADRLATHYVTVGGIVQAVQAAIDEGLSQAAGRRPLAPGSPLAVAHGTRYPIVQGPMTRVSDTTEFATAVADGGALPFLALAMMRGPAVRALLEEAKARLAGRAWGVGILGFVPPELRREQTAEIVRARPPFALIAGGRPDQSAGLEREGIATYLHAPSPGLLRQYLADGARRFVFEGRECGGHVGPRSSFVLWEQAVATLLEAIEAGNPADELHLLFAGGIHDARSAAGVAALAAPLAARGAKVGVLIGTAYLFTAEAIASGAIVPRFQAEAVACARTVLLETGPGHEVRVSPSPFAAAFEMERRRLLADRRPAAEIREALETLNVGRLRVAAKGLDRLREDGALAPVAEPEQAGRGLYMLGDAATLRRETTTIAALHRELSDGATALLERAVGPPAEHIPSRPSDVAIVGMAAIAPGAADVRALWENTLRGVDAITEVPDDRWNWRLYYDPDPKAPDKIVSKWGGFLPDVPFDPLRYGMPPTSLPSIEPMQLLVLEAVRAALDDAGYGERPFPRERTAVVLGAGGGAAQLAMGYAFRSYLPMLDTVLPGAGRAALERCEAVLPEWTEDSFPGILLNVAAGRVANRFDLGGANYTVDAACGSSLAAAALAVRELETGAADMVVLGGADTVQNPFTYLAFSKTHAFSPRGRCRPFDASADGIVISEGVAALILKRLADAERDGDRIYAVIKGLGASSDGRARGLTAPRPEGQIRALRRAYEKAGVSPATVGYVEAHGTGTAAGDLAEVESLTTVFRDAGAGQQECALGSVKSLIGHTKCAAGLMGLINASRALYHEVLPPTIGVETPNPRIALDASPFRLSTQARPWIHAERERPRRAGVSAFGFGGTNFHAVLEAHAGALEQPTPAQRDWPAELLAWHAPDREALDRQLHALERVLIAGGSPRLADVAHTLAHALPDAEQRRSGWSLAIVAEGLSDLAAKLGRARRALAEGRAAFHDPRGIDFAACASAPPTVAFVFPGQGAQTVAMLNDLAVAFAEVRRGFAAVDEGLLAAGLPPVSPRVFPPPAFTDDERARQQAELSDTQVAQPALAAACVGLFRQLSALGVRPDMTAGHSFGELVALHAAGSFSALTLAQLAEARGRLIKDACAGTPGAMAALSAGYQRVTDLLAGIADVWPVNVNGPRQTVVSGTPAAVEQVLERAARGGIRAQRLSVSAAFHSPFVGGAQRPFAELVAGLGIDPPRIPVYSNVTAMPHGTDIPARLGEHVARPVRFAEMIEAMYEAGSRVFVEVGPGGTLGALVGSILGERAHLAVSCDPPARSGLPGFLHALARLYVAGVPVRVADLAAQRGEPLDRDTFARTAEAPPETTWFVNGTRAKPAGAPEPPRLGPGPALSAPGPMNVIHDPTPILNNAARNALPQPPIGGPGTVYEAFQRTMNSFLDLQREAMLSFLGDSAPTAHCGNDQTPGRNGVAHAEQNGHAHVPRDNGHTARHVPAQAPATAAGLSERLLQIVRDRTGYPAEMLGLDLDLEADLGIDSIKRVEILGSLRDAAGQAGQSFDTALMDQLARERTLGGILRRVQGERGATASSNGHSEPRASTKPARGGPVRRLLLEAVEAPLPQPFRAAELLRGGLVVVTDDGRGIARAVGFDLKARGHDVVRIAHGSRPSDGDVEAVDLASPAAVAELARRLRDRGKVAGIVHALPLGSTANPELDPAGWDERIGPEVRGLFLLARELADDLEGASRQGGACLVAATGLGGSYASTGSLPAEFFAGHGGVAGLVKTLAHEWPRVRTRVVDFDRSGSIEVLGANLVHEVFADDAHAEVGYRDGRRWRLAVREAALSTGSDGGIALAPGAPVVITGGARGITAAVAADLARVWRPTLLLVGTSPAPPELEDPATAGLAGAAELKGYLLGRLSQRGRKPGPAELEQAYQALRREREVRANLRQLRALGVRVDYAAVDVRDGDALGRQLEAWRARFGPIAGFVHGAGVIQDKLLREKTPEAFDRVLGTKLQGALNLARLLDGDPLQFAAFFSSVAGRFGNQGQSDYAAANDALNKLALRLDRRWPARVVSLIWGPWSGVGMVSDLEDHLARRGLGMIAPEEGRSRLSAELRHGRKGEVEVVIAGALGALAGPPVAIGRVQELVP